MAGTGPTTTSDHHHVELATSINNRLKQLPAASEDCCIYTVPDRFPRGNKEAYTPRVVAIGPYHWGKKSLEPMEEQKLRYLQSFLQDNQRYGLEDYISMIKSREDQIRGCYDKQINADSIKFVEMMLLDGIFMIQLFLAVWNSSKWRRSSNDIFPKQWMINDIRRDMWLLENQIPFFVVQGLFEMAYGSHQEQTPGLLELTYWFLSPEVKIEKPLEESKVKHVLDMIRVLNLPSDEEALHKSHVEFKLIPTATQLVAAGVKLRRGKSPCLSDIKFKDGVLEIPGLFLDRFTGSYFRNIMAFEQCCFPDDSYLIDYIEFMDHLINTPGDAKLLIENEIIKNWLGNEATATNLLNSFCHETYLRTRSAHFLNLRHDLAAHCRRPCNKWKATFWRKYCSSPWTILSVIAAVVLLALTIAQTVCSVLSLK